MKKTLSILLIITLASCKNKPVMKNEKIADKKPIEANIKPKKKKDSLIYPKEFIATSFNFPVGKPNAKGYYNAQRFGVNNHLGDDWNAVTGGNSDLGHPIYSVANGYVKIAKDYGGGWGNVIRINHKLPNGKMVESLYAHCDTMIVTSKTWVKKGQKIGTIGNVNGQYYAHLHLEIRDNINLPIGGGYSSETKGYVNPTKFIKEHRALKK